MDANDYLIHQFTEANWDYLYEVVPHRNFLYAKVGHHGIIEIDINSKQIKQTFNCDVEGWISENVIIHNGRLFCFDNATHNLKGWNLANGAEIISAPGCETISCALTLGSNLLFSGDNDGKIHVWDLANGRHSHEFEAFSSKIRALKYLPQHNALVAVSSESSDVKIFNALTYTNIHTETGLSNAYSCCEFNGTLYIGGEGSRIYRLNLQSFEPLSPVDIPINETLYQISARYGFIVAAGTGKAIYVYNQNLHPIAMLENAHQDDIRSVVIAENGLIATASFDKSLKIFRLPEIVSRVQQRSNTSINPSATYY